MADPQTQADRDKIAHTIIQFDFLFSAVFVRLSTVFGRTYAWPPSVDDDDDDDDDGATEVQTNFCFATIVRHDHHKI